MAAWSSNLETWGRRVPAWSVRVGLLLVVLLLVVKTAWVGDDAFITLRTADNFLHGHGLTWNVIERVQPFTHPLWLLVLTGLHAIIGDAYATLFTASILATIAVGVLFFWRLAGSVRQAVLAGGVLILSKYFIDYCTSGLANPLLYLLIAWFVVAWFRLRDEGDGPRGRQVFWLVTAATLCGLTRLDSLALVGPPLVMALYRVGWRNSWRPLLAGTLPLVAWEIFAVVYYGSPLPNSAFAKLNTGIPAGELMVQGLRYSWHLLGTDPLLALVLVTAIVVLFTRSGPGEWSFGVGLVLTLIYIVRVGGDFMAGRFFTLPFFMAVCLLARRPPLPARGVGIVSLILLAALFVPHNAVTAPLRYENAREVHGIVDERGYYYEWNGLLTRLRDDPVEQPAVVAGHEMREFLAQRESAVGAGKSAGMMPYFAGPKLYFVDRLGLANVFLAHLPANRTIYHGGWRIGHFQRDFPEGFYDSAATDQNHLANPDLAELYGQVQLVTTGPLFTAARWRAIWALNLRALTGR